MHRLDRPGLWHPGVGSVRLIRAVSAGTISSATAWTAHAVGGGAVPALIAVAMLLGASGVAWMLAARRITGGQLVGLLLLCQAVTHITCASHTTAPMGTAMVAGHLFATAVSAVAMARGERWFWRVAEFLRTRLIPRVEVEAVPVWGRPLGAPARLAVIHHLRVASPFVRGPPVSTV